MSGIKSFVNEDAAGFNGTTDKGLFVPAKDVTLSTLLLGAVSSKTWTVYIDAPKPGAPGTYNSYLWLDTDSTVVVNTSGLRLKAGNRIRVITTGITPDACTMTLEYEENPL